MGPNTAVSPCILLECQFPTYRKADRLVGYISTRACPIVGFLAVFTVFPFGLVFLLFATSLAVFREACGFGPPTAGLAYLGQGIGSFATALVLPRSATPC